MIEFGDSVNFDNILNEVEDSGVLYPGYECDKSLKAITLNSENINSLIYGRIAGQGEDGIIAPSLEWRIRQKQTQFDNTYQREAEIIYKKYIDEFSELQKSIPGDITINPTDVEPNRKEINNAVNKEMHEMLQGKTRKHGIELFSLSDWKFPAYLKPGAVTLLNLYSSDLASGLDRTSTGRYYKLKPDAAVNGISQVLATALHRFRIQGHGFTGKGIDLKPLSNKYCLDETSFYELERAIILAITGSDMLTTTVKREKYDEKIKDLGWIENNFG